MRVFAQKVTNFTKYEKFFFAPLNRGLFSVKILCNTNMHVSNKEKGLGKEHTQNQQRWAFPFLFFA